METEVMSKTVSEETTNIGEIVIGNKPILPWEEVKDKTDKLRAFLDTKVGSWWSGFIVGTLNCALLVFMHKQLPKIRKKFSGHE